MDKRGLLTGFIALVIVMNIFPLASAEIFLGQLKPLYNWGDEFAINATLSPRANVNDFFSAKISCPGGETEIYKSSYNLKAGQQKQITISAKLDRFLILDYTGSCTIKASYGGDNAESQKFELSNEANVNIDLIGSLFNPGSKMPVSGKAQNVNGKNIEGFAEVTIHNLNISITTLVQNGKFQVNVSIPENAPSRNYSLDVYAYEKDSSGMITNEGRESLAFQIPQIIKEVEIAVEKMNIIPGMDFVYVILLKDQAGEDAKQNVDFKIIKPDNKAFFEDRIKAGEINILKIPKNASPGVWKSSAVYQNLKNEKAFNIERKEEASFELFNDTLIITNLGNVPYEEILEIDIGGITISKEVNLEVGETKILKLIAPNGNYPIKISEGGNFSPLGSAYLTGDSVNIKDLSRLQIGRIYKFVIWGIIILILAGISFIAYKRIEKKKYIGRMLRNDEKSTTLNPAMPIVGKEQGIKEEVSVIALKLKNLPEHLTSESKALNVISKTLDIARGNKARVYEQGEFKVMIFSPSLSGEKETELNAVRTANVVREIFDEHNKKYAQKIDYGIGIHAGEMILESMGEKAKFTSVGNATIGAKKAAEMAKSEILITRKIYRKVSNAVKSESYGNELWKVKNIIDRDKHKEFIKRFMSKNK